MGRWLTMGRVLRLAVIFVLGFIGVWALFPSLFTLVSNRAVVNSRLATAASTIDGTVSVRTNLRLGTRVEDSEVLARVVNPTLTTRLEELRGERRGWHNQLTALQQKCGDLDDFRDRLQDIGKDYKSAYLERLDARVAETKADIEAQQALVTQYAADEARATRLAASGNASQARLDEVRAKRRHAAALVSSKRAVLDRLQGERTAAEQGLFLADDFNNTPYSEQRADEVRLRLFDLSSEIAEAKRQITQLEAATDNELERQDREGWAAISAPVSGYVWEVPVSTGEYVQRAQNVLRIVDCARTFVDVTLDDSRLQEVNVGQAVTVDLLRSDRRLDGTVTAVRAASNLPDNLALTNKDIGRSFDDLQVLVRVDSALMDKGDHRFCSVGQRAIVDFDATHGLLDYVGRGMSRLQNLIYQAI